jgi:hypothetical protein
MVFGDDLDNIIPSKEERIRRDFLGFDFVFSWTLG